MQPSAFPSSGPAACGRPDGGEREARLVYHAIFRHSRVSDVGAQAIKNHVEHHGDMPVAGVRRYRRDWVVEKKNETELKSTGKPEGAVIGEFSWRARNRLLFWAKNCDCDFFSMLTVTYPKEFPRDGAEVKNDLELLKLWLKRRFRGIRGIWFLEFQRRGAPHFHLLLSVNLAGLGDLIEKHRTRKKRNSILTYRTHEESEQATAAAWFKIVGSGDEKHLRAGVSWEQLEKPDAAIRYASMHAAKPHQKEVPEEYYNVGRFWGKFGGVHLVGGEELEQVTIEELAKICGPEIISSKGRVKKYIYDAPKGEPIEKTI